MSHHRQRPDELVLPTPETLIGREDEWTSLLNAYRRVAGVSDSGNDRKNNNNQDSSSSLNLNHINNSSNKNKSEVVIVRGQAGAGKSFLLKKLQRTIERKDSSSSLGNDGSSAAVVPGGFYVQGNFDRRSSNKSAANKGRRASNGNNISSGSNNNGGSRGGGGLPYAAFTEALSSLVDKLSSLDQLSSSALSSSSSLLSVDEDDNSLEEDGLLNHVRDRLRYDLNPDETSRVCDVVPNLTKLLDIEKGANKNKSNQNTMQARRGGLKRQASAASLTNNASVGLRYAFKSFLRIVASSCLSLPSLQNNSNSDVGRRGSGDGKGSIRGGSGGPIVLVLDDAEAADEASIELIKSIASDPNSRGLLLVLCVREEEVFAIDECSASSSSDETDKEVDVGGTDAGEDKDHGSSVDAASAPSSSKSGENAATPSSSSKPEETKDNNSNKAGEVDEEEDYHPMRKVLHELIHRSGDPGGRSSEKEEKSEATGLPAVTEIRIGNMSPDNVNLIVAHALRQRDPEKTKSLSDVVYSKTHGNSFFVVQFLRRLVDSGHDEDGGGNGGSGSGSGLLTFSTSTFSWKWDVEKIQLVTDVSDNVATLVTSRIKRLPPDVRFVLQLASCLHSVVEVSVLTTIANRLVRERCGLRWIPKESDDQPSTDQLSDDINEAPVLECPSSLVDKDVVVRALDDAVSEGLMESVSSRTIGSTYKFAHDKIREAARSLADATLHLHVGEILRQIIKGDGNGDSGRSIGSTTVVQQGRGWMLFSCVDHLNVASKSIVDLDRRVELAALNLEAGERASSLSAFVPASEYYQAGIDLMDETQRWTGDDALYELCLKLHVELAVTQYCSGNFDVSQRAAGQVLGKARVLRDKIRCYFTMIALLKAKGQLDEAVSLGIDLMEQLGEKFSKKPSKLAVLSEKKKTRKISSKSDQELMSLPVCNDVCKCAAVSILGMLFGPMFHLGYGSALDVLRLKSIRLTIEHGVSEASALAYAYYGSHLISSECNLSEGYRFGSLALKLLDRLQVRDLKARTILVANFMIMHWKDPLQDTLDRLMNGYSVGMLSGDIEMAFTCAGLYQTHYFYCGMPLDNGEKDLRGFCQQMQEYKQTKELRTYQPLWQCMLNLMGRSKKPTAMTGDAMNQEEFEKGKLGVVVMYSYQLQVAYYFGDLSLAESLMDKLRPHSNSFTAPFFQVARRFFFTLTLLGLAHQSKKRRSRLIKEAKKDIEWLEKRVKQGAINCLPKLLVLHAELASFGKNEGEIKQGYDKAIKNAGRSGFRQDEALANELAGAYFLRNGDQDWASFYLRRSRLLYSEWGAKGKVTQLEQQYTELLDGEDQALFGTSCKGRRRFSARLSMTHKSVDSRDSLLSGLSEDTEGEMSAPRIGEEVIVRF